MYKLSFYIPESHLEEVKNALFQTGAGRIGSYDCCCWQVLGEGQFRPLLGSDPFLGSQGKVEKVAEYRVEMVCADNLIAQVVKTLKDSHPYETPAYNVTRLEEF
jgi:hypothetical protein